MRTRDMVAKWLYVHVVEVLATAAVLIVIAFLRAMVDGMIPPEWGVANGNHGPWRHYPRGREPLAQALDFLIYACAVSGILGIMTNKRLSIVLLLVCLASCALGMYLLQWLVD